MKTEDKEKELELIKTYSYQVFNLAEQNLKRIDSLNISESWAYELIDLTEWIVDLVLQRKVILYILKELCYNIPIESKGLIKKYFDLGY